MFPVNYRDATAIAAFMRACAVTILIAIGLMVGTVRAAAVNPDQPIRLDGMELFHLWSSARTEWVTR